MLWIMHEADERGVLILNGKPIELDTLAHMIGLDKKKLVASLAAIAEAGVSSQREDDGAIYSRRMVRDEATLQQKRECGKLGGNPALLKHMDNQGDNRGDNQKPTPEDKQNLTHSYSSSITSVKTTSDEHVIFPAMVASAVLTELLLAGKDLHNVIEEVVKAESRLPGFLPGTTRDAMIAAYRDYDANASKLTQFAPRPAKFFGEGYWRDRSRWPWKDGLAPAMAAAGRYWKIGDPR